MDLYSSRKLHWGIAILECQELILESKPMEKGKSYVEVQHQKSLRAVFWALHFSAVLLVCHAIALLGMLTNFCVLGVVLSVRPSTLRPGNELCPVRHPPKLPFNKAGITVWAGSTPFFPSDLTVPSFPAAIQLRYRWDIAMDVFLSCLQISVFSHLTKL